MDSDERPESEGPWQVAAGTPGNRRFGALLKYLREHSGLTPQQLAERADVHVSFVRGIERGAQAPSVATARPLLACMKEQDRIRWMDTGPYDLLVRDPKTGRDVAFEFKAKKRGQNRRTDADLAITDFAKALLMLPEAMRKLDVDLTVTDVARALLMLPEAMQRSVTQGVETREPRAYVVRPAGEEQPRRPAPSTDARFGKVVRLLAAADEEVLGRVESLLRDELGPGQSGS